MADDLLEIIIYVVIVVGLVFGAYLSYRRARSNGTWSARAATYTAAALAIFIMTGLSLVAAYSLIFAPNYLGAFTVIMVVFLVGGLYVIARLGFSIEARTAPVPPSRPGGHSDTRPR